MEQNEQVGSLYQAIFKVAKHFIEQSKANSIIELREHDEPTYAELAMLAKDVASILEAIANIEDDWDNQRLALNSKQAALHMEQMALAINNDDQTALQEELEKLEKLALI